MKSKFCVKPQPQVAAILFTWRNFSLAATLSITLLHQLIKQLQQGSMQDFSYCTPLTHLRAVPRITTEEKSSLCSTNKSKRTPSSAAVGSDTTELLSSSSSSYNKGSSKVRSRKDTCGSSSSDCYARSDKLVHQNQQHHLTAYSSGCSSVSHKSASSSTDEGMDMKYAEKTHDQLRNSLAKINSSSASANNTKKQHNYFCRHDGSQLNYSNYVDEKSNVPRYDAIIRSKDSLLQEKETEILDLRLQKANLEHRLKEFSAGLFQVRTKRYFNFMVLSLLNTSQV